ncbi:Crp/Fnr family transcriptional regulator [uncultured Sulfitobacter sp.]|uniref:Crp/Fnr family transcriptional regulator n=1 Tax=uncultured Sulfitobacter sp. TaxID=191468 RepID=UPI002625057B|nr:Crp/Fnr family transcriptional regulator [uncultured Sulfitobacter sp.]
MIFIMSKWLDIFDGVPVRKVAKGSTLFHQGDPVQFMYLVCSGAVALERPMTDGVPLTLHIATANMALAEASLFADAYHCDAVARTDSAIASLPRAKFLAFIQKHPDAALSLIETHAKEVQAQRTRIEILRLRRVAERLDAWVNLYGEPPKGEWINVADQIGVSAPALYRELAIRRGNA